MTVTSVVLLSRYMPEWVADKHENPHSD